MWELIDWSESSGKKENNITTSVIERFFRGIFQVKFLDDKPTIHDASDIFNDYEQNCKIT